MSEQIEGTIYTPDAEVVTKVIVGIEAMLDTPEFGELRVLDILAGLEIYAAYIRSEMKLDEVAE